MHRKPLTMREFRRPREHAAAERFMLSQHVHDDNVPHKDGSRIGLVSHS